VRAAGLDGQGVDARLDQALQGIIHKAVPGHPRESLKACADDSHGVVTAFSSAGMAGVEVAVILNRQFRRLQGGSQRGLNRRCAGTGSRMGC